MDNPAPYALSSFYGLRFCSQAGVCTLDEKLLQSHCSEVERRQQRDVRPGALGITNLGFTQTQPDGANPLTGTLMYIAPEVLAGNAPSAFADVYALGVLLYQLVIGDFRRPLAPGWEAGVSDPLLRQDIADAACGDAEKRLGNAAELADRLKTLEARRVRQSELEAAQLRAEVAERKLAEARADALGGTCGRGSGGGSRRELDALSRCCARARPCQPAD